MLSNKAILILQFLVNNNKATKLKEIADYLELNERVIRYEIEKMCEFMNEKNNKYIELSKGYFIINDLEKVNKIVEENYNCSYFSAKEREIYILTTILYNREINLTKICDELGVSRSTIKIHLREIIDILNNSRLQLKNSHKKGLILVGTEENIRQCYLKVYSQFSLNQNQLFKNYLNRYFFVEDEGITLFINYCQKLMYKIISDEAFRIIKRYLNISILMIKNGCALTEIKNENFLKNTVEYPIIKKGISLLEAHYEVEINLFEQLKIVDYFLGSHSYNINYSYYENWVEMEILIKKLIYSFNKRIDVDISQDNILLEGLLNHIKPTIYRLQNGMELENSIYKEVIDVYPHLFQITKEVLEEVENFMQIEFSNDEIAFLVLHFRAAIDRNRTKSKNRKNVLLVCGQGYGTSKLLAQQLKEMYSINIIDIVPHYLFSKAILNQNIDLVISTVNIDIKTDIPIIKVSPLLTNEDITNLNNFKLNKSSKKVLFSEILNIVKNNCNEIDEENLKKELKETLKGILVDDTLKKNITIYDMLEKKNIMENIEAKTWEEAVYRAGEILVSNGYVEKSYIEDTVESIRKYGSYAVIIPKIAFPHSKSKNNVYKSAFAIVTLKEEVMFPDNIPVKTIVLFCSRDNIEHLDCFIELVDIMNSPDFNLTNFVKKICKK